MTEQEEPNQACPRFTDKQVRKLLAGLREGGQFMLRQLDHLLAAAPQPEGERFPWHVDSARAPVAGTLDVGDEQEQLVMVACVADMLATVRASVPAGSAAQPDTECHATLRRLRPVQLQMEDARFDSFDGEYVDARWLARLDDGEVLRLPLGDGRLLAGDAVLGRVAALLDDRARP